MLRITGRQATCYRLCRTTVNAPPERRLYEHGTGARGQRRLYAIKARDRSRSLDEDFLAALRKKSTIRQTLRQWEIDNPQPPSYAVSESLGPGEIPNQFFKSQALSGMREARQPEDANTDEMGMDETGAVESGTAAPTDQLRPGTLIELRLSDSRIPLLAVILGRFCGVYYFLARGGQLAADDGRPSVLFSVPDFATPAQMKSLVDFIPKDRYLHPREVANDYQLPPGLGAQLNQKITTFANDASLLFQGNLSALSAADTALPHPTEFTTLSLDEIARSLIPDKARPDGKYDPSMLYAVHTGLLNNDADAFRPLNKINAAKHVSYLYRVSPASSIRIIRKVRSQVRYIMETLGTQTANADGKMPQIKCGLWRFIIKARRVIKESRTNRAWTDHGTLVPHPGRYPSFDDWTDGQREFLHFIELWVGSHVHRDSTLHGMGSAILHLTGMYKPARQLNAGTGWAFLQELGWIPSWELPTRHKSPIPGAKLLGGGGYVRPSPGPYEDSMREDIAAPYRKDWGSLKAYCIDAPSTTLLDDAISVEATETKGEYWIHAHIADPASIIEPNSKLTEFAGIMAMDHFIPGYRCSMFPEQFYDEVIMKQLSLDRGRPCLTFSTRLNEAGEVLEVQVQPGTLQNLVFLSPDDVDTFCPPLHVSPPPPGADSLLVGASQNGTAAPTRNMSQIADLSTPEKSDLRTMHRLLTAVDGVRLERGAIPQSRVSRSVRVSFGGAGSPEPEGVAETWPGDPTIEVAFDERKDRTLVSMAMMLSGESAAKWCHERRIPIPFHTQPGALRNPGALQALGDEIRRLTDGGEPVPMALWRKFDQETGPTAQSVEPSPIIPLGLEMYAKVTSPLRRLSDCMVHWQIHAFLRSAHAKTTSQDPDSTGQPGDSSSSPAPPSFSSSPFPWPKPALRSKLESLRLSTFTSHTLSRQGSRPWTYQALFRAWKFGESPLPRALAFTVGDVYGHVLTGELDFLAFRAVMRKADLDGVALAKDLKAGDRLEVEIADVDVYECALYVKAVRRMGVEGGGEGGEPVAAVG